MSTYGQFREFGPFLSSSGALYLLKVYHYLPGTTTLQNMWVERTKATTVAQPLESDSAGIASAFGDGIYKFRIDGSTDGVSYSTIYTWDNVSILDQGVSEGEGDAIASASTLTLGTDGDIFHVTGSTGPITAISGTQDRVTLVFDSTPTLTHSGNLILYNSASFTAAAGDVLAFFNEGSGIWRETSRRLASGLITASGLTQSTARLLGRTTASTGAIEEITVGNGLTMATWSIAADTASETVDGIVELATQAEVNAMTDTGRVITPNHNKIVLGTAVASTSGTTIDFTGIPAGVRCIRIGLMGVSLSGTDSIRIQLGDAGGFETSNYLGATSNFVSTGNMSSGFDILTNDAANVVHGIIRLYLLNSSAFTWAMDGVFGLSSTTTMLMSAGTKSLSAELTQVRITTSGANTFDAGSINIQYER